MNPNRREAVVGSLATAGMIFAPVASLQSSGQILEAQKKCANRTIARRAMEAFGLNSLEVEHCEEAIVTKDDIVIQKYLTKMSNTFWGMVFPMQKSRGETAMSRRLKGTKFETFSSSYFNFVWSAILVCFRTGENGFEVFEIEPWWMDV